ncbi:hypothetical protein SAMD00023353_0802290 [Rosellinia necatrix]|uniref:DUF202 domain-containing protein n=1 Tax=Rosellinia necatrix TaxID=77044 RepID=A0A1W2TB89_ROSNE|nr:hypothetical protein SAMD00023353_0802290 [Rosellinia necatrix]
MVRGASYHVKSPTISSSLTVGVISLSPSTFIPPHPDVTPDVTNTNGQLLCLPINPQLEADMFEPHPEEHLHLRLHRAASVALTSKELVEIRAAQRTFEGAYTRTALSQFSFALIILKIFTSEFYAIGALFAVYGATVMLCAMYRRYEGNRQFFSTTDSDGKVLSKFRTSNNSVLLLTVLSLGAYIGLLILTWNLS